MASGLAALLDDVAAIAKIAAASVDDVAGAAGKAGSKAVGVVVDDTAVTPGYAMGFTPDRELPIVWKIALGSLRNKFFFLLPGALALSAFAPWLVTPLLMIGGSYLAFEASEKILEIFVPHEAGEDLEELALSSTDLEDQKVAGAIRTDLILSAEIMFIALADVAERPFAIQAAALAIVGLAITIGVYGVVGLLVKMDDIGLHMAKGSTRVWVSASASGVARRYRSSTTAPVRSLLHSANRAAASPNVTTPPAVVGRAAGSPACRTRSVKVTPLGRAAPATSRSASPRPIVIVVATGSPDDDAGT